MDELERWAKSLGDLGVKTASGSRYFPSRQMTKLMRASHAEGRLFEGLTEWLPEWKYRQNKATDRMEEILIAGGELWESIVADTDRPWSPYISEEQRAGLLHIVERIERQVESRRRLVERLRAHSGQKPSP